jgi:hypothetical protein
MKKTWLFAILALALAVPVIGQEINVTSPDSGTSWKPGSNHTITWTKSGTFPPGTLANITLRRERAAESDPPAARICDGCANNSSRLWLIPATQPEGRFFIRIRVGEVVDDSEVFSISDEGESSEDAGPDSWIRADLAIVGVGVECLHDQLVVWVKNNGPDAVRSHNVKFRRNFVETGEGEQVSTKLLTIPVGEERAVELEPLAASGIPNSGLRVSVRIDPALSHIQDANRLNQHRDVRLGTLDIVLAAPRSDLEISRLYLHGGEDYRVKFKIHVRHNLTGRTLRNIRVIWQMTGETIPVNYSFSYTIASLAPGAEDIRPEDRTFGKEGARNAKKPELRPGAIYRIRAWIDDADEAFYDIRPGNDTASFSFSFSAE